MTVQITQLPSGASFDDVFALIEREGEEWADYVSGDGRERYEAALRAARAFIAMIDDEVVGYARVRDDEGFGVYVFDLLVDRAARGQEIGRSLLEAVAAASEGQDVYVLGDVPEYYETHLGYPIEGKVYRVPR